MSFWQRWFGQTERRQHQQKLMESLLAMAWFVEARDPYTGGHMWRVSRFSKLLAEAAGLAPADVARISLGGFLHDLGKVGVPDAILRKTDRLTEDEYAVIKTHPEVGLRMLAGHPLSALVQDAIAKHHERPDGKGYPYGLTDQSIPVDAHIVGICDAFDAMTSHRPYRKGMPRDKALAIIREEAGRQFNRILVERFMQLGASGELDHIIGHSDDGIPLQYCPACGPTLVLSRRSRAGQSVYCRNCTGEFVLVEKLSQLIAEPTGRQGQAKDLEPEADMELIACTVNAIASALPVDDLFKFSAA